MMGPSSRRVSTVPQRRAQKRSFLGCNASLLALAAVIVTTAVYMFVLLPSSSPSLPHQRRPEPLVRSSGVSAALRGTKVWSAPPVRQEGSDKVEEEVAGL
eukprot:jgi/Mesvir1/26056/Mv08233-RA.1